MKKIFMTLVSVLMLATASAQTKKHAYVDLGLPSGTLWATCNVGADNPWEYGNFYAVGETEPKEEYQVSNYKHCDGDDKYLTKYCNDSSIGKDGFVDNKLVLDPQDDAATKNWGSAWCMPTEKQLIELKDECEWRWGSLEGVNGYVVVSKVYPNRYIFFPACGFYSFDWHRDEGTACAILSREIDAKECKRDKELYFNYGWGAPYIAESWRFYGSTVRPVRARK